MKHKILFIRKSTEVLAPSETQSSLPDGIDFDGIVVIDNDIIGRFYGDPSMSTRYPEQLAMLVVPLSDEPRPDMTADELFGLGATGQVRQTTLAPRPRFFEGRVNDLDPGRYDIYVISTRL